MEQYCIYLRKSRSDSEVEDRGGGETFARHKAALDELSHRMNLNVTKTYREVVSGETISDRPVIQQLLSEVEQGLWAGVLVMEVERLARGDTIDQGTIAKIFKYSDTKIITPMKTYDPNDEYDEEFFEFSLFMSRREYKIINRRLQRGRLASVKEGKFVAHRPPYGYTRKKLEKEKGWTLEPHPEQAKVVRMIFDLCVTGELQQDGSRKLLGTSLITRRLNQLKIPASNGGLWVVASVRNILINPAYIGKIRWNWKPAIKKMTNGQVQITRSRSKPEDWIIVDGLHEGIIDEDVFNMAGEIMKNNSRTPVTDRNVVKNPLAGIVICGKCGRRMVRRPYNNTKYPDTLMCVAPECPTVSVFLHSVEARVLEALEEWLGEYKLQWGLDGTASSQKNTKNKSHLDLKKKAMDKITEELGTLHMQKSKLHDFLEQGVYDVETFNSRAHELGERIRQTENSLAAVGADVQLEEMREESRTIVPKAQHILDVYRTLPDAKSKNDMLKIIIEKVVYAKEKGGRWHSSPDDFEIILYPKLPIAKNHY